VYRPAPGVRALLALVSLLACPLLPLSAERQTPSPQSAPKPVSDLDALMAQALARRDVQRSLLNQYVLDETESFEVLGPGRMPMHRMKREFTWYARDGMHVRSPVRFDGVAIRDADRRKYEDEWIKREQERQERKARKEPEKTEIALGTDGVQVSGITTSEPRFVSEAYFMDFKFEPGNYYLAGREKLEGHDVLRIEYYPTHLFNETDDEKTPREMKKNKDARAEQDIDRKMNKTALVTLWVDQAEHQIVKYTFDNVWLDFLPAAWLVRIDDLRASMTMGQPFAGVWLPRSINIQAGFTLATGSFAATYDRAFANYREGDVKTTIKVPKLEAVLNAPLAGGPSRMLAVPPTAQRAQTTATEGPPGHGPMVDEVQPVETVREVRVHGNATLTDDEVMKLAGIAVGDPLSPTSETEITERLKNSHRFESVDVRKRYRALDDPTDVALVLVVHERPGVASGGTEGGTIPSPWQRFTHRLMFFPILNYTDGYGLTYGGRVSTVNLLGARERLSVPLTWGGTRRAAAEVERTFESGPFTRLFSSVGIQSRENPHFDIDDRRVIVQGRAERQFTRLVRTGVEATRSSVEFGSLDDTLWTVGADAAIDTRADPAFPGNAVVLGAGWSALHVSGGSKINRYNVDTRGYWRVAGQSVVAGRVQYFDADGRLPPYERLLLGGATNLRGFRAGAFDADRMVITSAELRAPLTSVLHGARLGATVFVDAAKAVDFGTSLSTAAWHQGAGGGLFIIAPLVRINLNVAHGVGTGTRVNLATGFSF
jgi:hypothetical protein